MNHKKNYQRSKPWIIFPLLICFLLPNEIWACWISIPLPKRVQTQSLIVIGKIIKIDRAPKAPLAKDIAFIQIEQILKQSKADKNVVIGKTIPLSMPSINRTFLVSTDIRYRKGQHGVWLLNERDGTYRAEYPKDFQDISEAPKIAKIVNRQRLAANQKPTLSKGASRLRYLASR